MLACKYERSINMLIANRIEIEQDVSKYQPRNKPQYPTFRVAGHILSNELDCSERHTPSSLLSKGNKVLSNKLRVF